MPFSIDETTYNRTLTHALRDGYQERGVRPSAIVIHSTNGRKGSTFAAEAKYLRDNPNVSTHYLVGKDGQIALIVPAILAMWLTVSLLDHRPLRTFGIGFLPHWRQDIMFGLAISAGMLAVMIGTHIFFQRSLLGRAMRAAAADREAAGLVGINVGHMAMWSFVIAAAIGAIAGLIITPLTLTSVNVGLMLGFKGFSAAMLGGLGNREHFDSAWQGGFRGMAIRLFDRALGQWRIWWASDRQPTLEAPVVGGFDGEVGNFYSRFEFAGKNVLCRYRWTRLDPDRARWDQAFSVDDGANWECNWVMHFVRLEAHDGARS